MKIKPIVLIKIGGSLITDKNKPSTLKERALSIICDEIKKARETGKILILGHGGGSFPHFPAKKYQTHKGIINDASYIGIAEVADAAAQLNRIVVRHLVDRGVPAISFSPLNLMLADDFSLKNLCSDTLEEALELNLLPVLYGDQVLDTKRGCTIFSTERVLGYLGLHLKGKGYEIEQIIHCGQTNGVYDADGGTIPLITSKNIDRYRKVLGGSGGTDVTGGMIHKVEETLSLAKSGIHGLIIDGIEYGTLSKAVLGQPILGTRVEW